MSIGIEEVKALIRGMLPTNLFREKWSEEKYADTNVPTWDKAAGKFRPGSGGAGGGAPTDADYLVGTSNASLSAEIVVGPTPGGELGGTWPSPTVDATHSGSAHHTRAHAILDSSDHSDSLTGSVVDGDTLIGNVTPKWSRLAISIPAANILNVFAVANGELRPSWKAIFDGTNPAAIGTAAPGTSLIAAHRDHVHATTLTSEHSYVFHTTEAWGVAVAAGVQKGYHHTGSQAETALELICHSDAKSANSWTVTIEISSGNDLDGSPTWATVTSLTMLSTSFTISSGAVSVAMAADRLLRLNIGTITSTAPQDVTVILRATRSFK